MANNVKNGKKTSGEFCERTGNKRRFYPVRDADNPSKVSLMPISEEVYREIFPMIWQIQKRMQRIGRCVCPKSMLWACDADCPVCRYKADGNQVPLDTAIDDEGEVTIGDTLTDESPSPESIAIDQALLEMLYQELEELAPEGRRICELMMNCSEREAAAKLNMARSTFKYQWERVKAQLRDKLKEFMA